MGRLAGENMPFAPWADRDHPDPDADARYNWGLSQNYVDGETVALAEADPQLDGRVFFQQESDPFAFVDGDDVRDPERGVHPAFVEILDALGATYADVSTSRMTKARPCSRSTANRGGVTPTPRRSRYTRTPTGQRSASHGDQSQSPPVPGRPSAIGRETTPADTPGYLRALDGSVHHVVLGQAALEPERTIQTGAIQTRSRVSGVWSSLPVSVLLAGYHCR
jgi:hypothetical protein